MLVIVYSPYRYVKNFLLIALALVFLTNNTLFAQNPEGEVLVSEQMESEWKGFDRLDFEYQGREARLVLPEHPLPHNPWIWRARFPDWHTEADSILVSKGYHLAYVNTNNLYGSPKAIKAWDDFYDYVTREYKLNKKTALMGVSRGGLFVYNWAKQNPQKVACIYAEAPVCDFKSWPAGFGKSQGSQEDWEQLKEVYGFENDEKAKAYLNNPIDGLGPLAAQKVPILHMIGLKDKIVPPEENTYPLVQKYISFGGSATVVPSTGGEQQLQGHHFPVETPGLVADFIQYHTKNTFPLSSSNYHEMRGGLENAKIQFEQNKKGRVAFLGGSITYNSGWRDSVTTYLQKRFPATSFEFIEAGIPSMGTTPAAFRLRRDVLSAGKVDLLFEEAAVNDATNGRTSEEQVRAMEGIIRHLRRVNPAIDIIMMHFVDPDKIKTYNQNKIPEVILNHNKVADHYNIPVINLAKEVTDRINKGEFSWEADFKDLHPSPFGQGVYANSILQFLEQAFIDHPGVSRQMMPHDLPAKLDENAYDNGFLVHIKEAKLSRGWKLESSWNPGANVGTRENYVDVPMLVGTQPNGTLKLNFEGSSIGIAVAAGPDAGMIEYRIDRHKWIPLNLFTKWSGQLHLPWYYTLGTGLSKQQHILELRILGEKDKRSSGYACRIRYFFVDGN
ncbi:MAG: GDSL-type esterase/lipase family protein [Flavobacteriaceae bacterium]